jgi:peptide/nickel transport system permease protein
MRAAYGFDKPLPVQFGLWLMNALQGDLGKSIATGRPVATEVGRAVMNTLRLAFAASLIGFPLGLFLGFLAGYL